MARYYLNQSNTAAEQGQTAANAPATERDVSRKALGKLTKTQASGTSSSRISSSDSQSGGISRGSMQVGSRVEGISQPTNSVGFDIFSDSRPEGGLYDQGAVTASSMLTENKNWTQLAPQKAIRKENDGEFSVACVYFKGMETLNLINTMTLQRLLKSLRTPVRLVWQQTFGADLLLLCDRKIYILNLIFRRRSMTQKRTYAVN